MGPMESAGNQVEFVALVVHSFSRARDKIGADKRGFHGTLSLGAV